jgi:isoquinoline 1-oxidoreductase subunit beta
MKLNINGEQRVVDDPPREMSLLWVLRDLLGHQDVKFGCGEGHCRCCTVLVDGEARPSCQMTACDVGEREITTAQGAAGPVIEAVRAAWYRGNVVQCGMCQVGQTLGAATLLAHDDNPDDAAIDAAMSPYLCRCGTYPRIRAGIHQAAADLRDGRMPGTLPAPVEVPYDPGYVAAEPPDGISEYLRIGPNGTVTVMSSQVELGQGVEIGLATIVAEELDVDISAVRIMAVANDRQRYGNVVYGRIMQMVGDSTSTGDFWMLYRIVAAKARARLVAAAEQRWSMPASGMVTAHGRVFGAGGRTASYQDLAAEAAQLRPPATAWPKDPSEYRLIGRDTVPRIDAAAKIKGEALYTMDIAWPGLLTAVVAHPPRFGSTVRSFNAAEILARPGVVAAVPISRGVAVVATGFAAAYFAAGALRIDWDETAAERRGSPELRQEHLRLLDSGEGTVVAADDGDVEAAVASAPYTVDATYELPYQAHAPMEGDNAACRMLSDGTLEVHVGAMSPDITRLQAARAAGLEEDRVLVHIELAGGGFGLRASAQQGPVVEAVETARTLGWQHPIRVETPRDEEFRAGPFRPMSVHRVRLAADAAGTPVAYKQRMVLASIMKDMPLVSSAVFHDGFDEKSVVGSTNLAYHVPNVRVEATTIDTAVPVTSMRSVGDYHNVFVREALMDELAEATGADPLDLRRRAAGRNRRLAGVIDEVARRAGWHNVPAGTALGMAALAAYRSFGAQVIQVSRDAEGMLQVDRAVAVIDAGIAVNPDIIKSQIEGGIIFGLSAALWGEITLRDGIVEQRNFDTYPLLRMRTCPRIDIHVVDSREEPGGIGELGVPAVAPALVNAVARLTGRRIRTLPLSRSIGIRV